MFSNLKSKKRLTQLLIAVLVVALTATGCAFLMSDFVQQAKAQDYTISSPDGWNEAVNSGSAIVNIKLDGDITVSSETGGKLAAIPKGVTVNLDMDTHNIIWDYVLSDSSWNSNLMAASYGSGTYASGEYWGFITNNGTLNISGKGIIRNKKIHVTSARSDHDDSVQRLATIVNTGTLELGSDITIDAYLSFAHESSSKYSALDVGQKASYSHNYLYNCAVYNENGTVTSYANINAGTLTGYSMTNTSGRAYSFVYGIYGGEIYVKGGNIYLDSFAGGIVETLKGTNAHSCAYAVGVYGENAEIGGNTTINAYTKNWRCNDSNSNVWKDGRDYMFATGVLYTSSCPVIGPSVDIVASFDSATDSNIQVWVPGGNSGMWWSSCKSENESNNRSHIITPVAQVSGLQNNIGTHTSECDYSTAPFGSDSAAANVVSTAYKTLHASVSGATDTASTTIINTSDYGTLKKVTLVDGYDGKSETGSITSGDSNVHYVGDYSPTADGCGQGGQYVIVYRYYASDGKTLQSASYTPIATYNEKAIFTPYNGAFTSGSTISYYTGGGVKNSRYYSYIDTYVRNISSSDFVGIDVEDVSGDISTKGTSAQGKYNDSGEYVMNITGASTGYTTLILVDYKAIKTTNVNLVVANADTTINNFSDGNTFTTAYTGKALVPGTDFSIGVIDINYDTTDIDDYENYTVATDYYDVTGGTTDGSKINLTYAYSTDGGSTYTSDLPKDVGTYTIKITVPADKTLTSNNLSTSGNHNGGSFIVKCTITAVEPEISNYADVTGVYGSKLNSLVSTTGITVTGKNGEKPEGTWSYALDGTTVDPASVYPTAGSHIVKLTWTPTSEWATNYKAKNITFNLEVSKRPVTVKAVDMTGSDAIYYGTSNPTFSVEYSYNGDTANAIPDVDKSKMSTWLAAATFTVNGNAYSSKYIPGNYTLVLTSFAEDDNYTFTVDKTEATLTIKKAPLYYEAVATDKTYNGKADDIAVTLYYANVGLVNGDIIDDVIYTTGNVSSADASDKAKTVTDYIPSEYACNDRYDIVVNTEPTVLISKADVTVSVPSMSLTYDKNVTLSEIEITGATAVAGYDKSVTVDGTWSWENGNTNPTCDVTGYRAVFTPASGNFNSATYDVTINVAKRNVAVTVTPIEVTYGDAVPSLNLAYDFTDGNSIANVSTTGSVQITTDYYEGAAVGTPYAIYLKDVSYSATNYNFVLSDSTITVGQKAITVFVKNDTATYGDATPSYNENPVKWLSVAEGALVGEDTLDKLNDSANFTITTTYDYEVEANRGAGTYPITATGKNTTNYTFNFIDGELVVSKATLTLKADDKTISYGAAKPAYTYTASGFKYGEDKTCLSGAPTYTCPYDRNDTINSKAGTYTITITQGTLSSDNYKFDCTDGYGTLTVNKLKCDTENEVTAKIIHGEAYSSAEFVETFLTYGTTDVKGTFTFANPDTKADYTSDECMDDDVSFTDGYDKYIEVEGIFTPVDSDNYEDATVTVLLYIAPHAISGTPVISGTAMVDETLTANVSTMSPSDATYYDYQWYVGGTKAGNNATYEVTDNDVGNEIYVVVTAKDDLGYTGSKESGKVTAQKAYGIELNETTANAAITPYGFAYTYTYDAANHTVDVKPVSGQEKYVGDITVYYNGTTEYPKNAGTYVVTIDVGEAEYSTSEPNACYRPVSGLQVGTITIAKAKATAVITASDKVYDGTTTVIDYKPSLSVTVSGANVHLDDSVISIRFADSSVGEQNVIVSGLKLYGDDAANFELATEAATANITKKALKVEAYGVERAYNESAEVSVTFVVDTKSYASVDSSKTVYLANGTATAASANAGSSIALTDIKYDILGDSSGNYYVEITNAPTVNITKATPIVAIPDITDEFIYDADFTLDSIILSNYYTADNRGFWVWDDTSVVPTVKKTSYAATFKSKNDNYTDYSCNIPVTVKPREVELKAADITIAYGSDKPTFTVDESVKLTGSDTVETLGGTLYFECSYTKGSGTGDYVITVQEALNSNGNYTFVCKPATLTVVPAKLYVTATADNRDYNGSTDVDVAFSIASGLLASDSGSVALSTQTAVGTASSANAGTRTVAFTAPTLTGSKASNYELVITPAELTVVINKLDPKGVVFPASATVEFSRDLATAVFSEAQGDGTFSFTSKEVPNAIGVYYNYEVVFTPKDAVNYNTLTSKVTLTVTECQLNYVVGISGTAQVGQKLTAVITGMPTKAYDYIQYQWYRIDGNVTTAITGANTATYTATEQDVGYTLAVMTYFDSTDPYIFAEDVATWIGEIEGILGSTDSTVKEENLTFWQRLVRWIQSIIDALTGIFWLM